MKDRWIVTLIVVCSGCVAGGASSGGGDTEREVGEMFADPRSSSRLLNGQVMGHFVGKSNELGNGPVGWPLGWTTPANVARELHLGPCHFEVVDWDGTKVTGHHAMVGYADVNAGIFYVDVPNANGDGTRHLYGYTLFMDVLTLVPINSQMDHWSVLVRVDDDPPPRQEDYWCLPVSCCDGTLSPSCTYGSGSLSGCCSYHGGVCGPAVQ